jgi:uncharacterized protein YbjT (DUF2867 family)
MKTALIAGATGLIGRQLLKKLIADPWYSSVVVVSRKSIEERDSKVRNIVIGFDDLSEAKEKLVADDVFCCLGTTMKKAGSKEAFRKVDFQYPVDLARLTFHNGAKIFLLVSALGANKKSSFYYNAVKGEVEEAIGEFPFGAYHIFRPSLLLGERNESRPAEEAAKKVYKIFSFLIPEKFKGVEGSKVAAAMLYFAKSEGTGKFIHESQDLQRFNI